jgi:hypothetical protein
MPIAGSARAFTDTTATAGVLQCWAVKAVDASGARSAAAMATDGVTPYVCKQSAGTTLPMPGPITIQPLATGLRILWAAPTFTSSTVPASALTGYEVWRRADPQTQTTGWVRVVALGPTVTAWNDPSPFPGGNCYQVRANYGTLGYKENDTTCATFAPAPLQAPTNLREVVPPAGPVKGGKAR